MYSEDNNISCMLKGEKILVVITWDNNKKKKKKRNNPSM